MTWFTRYRLAPPSRAMTSKTFIAISEAGSADEAFVQAVADAKEYGEGRDTGSIIGKKSFIILQDDPFPNNETVRTAVNMILENGDESLEKLNAPAGCYLFKFLGRSLFMFFGWSEV